MKVEIVINGGVSLILEPESTSEEEALKELVLQKNDIVLPRDGVTVLGKTMSNCLLITSSSGSTFSNDESEEDNNQEQVTEETEEEEEAEEEEEPSDED